jgi:hypothetical protein
MTTVLLRTLFNAVFLGSADLLFLSLRVKKNTFINHYYLRNNRYGTGTI